MKADNIALLQLTKSNNKSKTATRYLFVLGLTLALLIPSAIQAELTFPEDNDTYIIDDIDAIDETDELAIDDVLYEAYDLWGTEIVVVLIESTANYQPEPESNTESSESTNESQDNNTNSTDGDTSNNTGNDSANDSEPEEEPMSLQDFSVALFEEWELQESDWQDSILLVIATNQSGTWEWWMQADMFWDDVGDFSNVGVDSESSFDSGDWANGVLVIAEDLVWAVDDELCYQYPADCETPPVVTDPSNNDLTVQDGEEVEASTTELIIGAVFCLAILAGIVFLVVLVGKSGGTSHGGGWRTRFTRSRYDDPYYDPYGGNNYIDHREVHHHHNAPQQQSSPAQKQAPASRKDSAPASRRSSRSSRGSRGGGASRGSRGSGGSSGGSTRGSSRGGDRKGGGRRRR